MMSRWFPVAVLAALILFGSTGVALAQDNKLDSDAVGQEMTKFVGYAKILAVAFLVVAILWAIARALSTAHDRGGFGVVIGTVAGILLAAATVWLVLKAFGDDPKSFTTKPVQIQKGQ